MKASGRTKLPFYVRREPNRKNFTLRAKMEFLTKYPIMRELAFGPNPTPIGRKNVAYFARLIMGYSEKTVDCDILSALNIAHKKLLSVEDLTNKKGNSLSC